MADCTKGGYTRLIQNWVSIWLLFSCHLAVNSIFVCIVFYHSFEKPKHLKFWCPILHNSQVVLGQNFHDKSPKPVPAIFPRLTSCFPFSTEHVLPKNDNYVVVDKLIRKQSGQRNLPVTAASVKRRNDNESLEPLSAWTRFRFSWPRG